MLFSLFLTTLLAYLTSPVAAGSVAYYWGQASAGFQNGLASYCQSGDADIVILSFLYQFPGPGNVPTLNFAAACYQTFPNGLLNCPQIGDDIKTCQSLGKTVLLSLGGAAGVYGFSSDTQAQQFAGTLWNLFGEGSASERPFGDAVVDGFDFDIENNNPTGYAALATELRNYFAKGSKNYYLSAAPQCPYPDASIGNALANAHFDFAFIQFYNNYCSLDGQFNWDTWVNFAQNVSPNKNIKLFVGLAGSPSAAGSGYVPIETVQNVLSSISSHPNFGGAAVWDASQAFSNMNNGVSFAASLKKIVGSSSNNQPAVSSSQNVPQTSDKTSTQPESATPSSSVPVSSSQNVPQSNDKPSTQPDSTTPSSSVPVSSFIRSTLKTLVSSTSTPIFPTITPSSKQALSSSSLKVSIASLPGHLSSLLSDIQEKYPHSQNLNFTTSSSNTPSSITSSSVTSSSKTSLSKTPTSNFPTSSKTNPKTPTTPAENTSESKKPFHTVSARPVPTYLTPVSSEVKSSSLSSSGAGVSTIPSENSETSSKHTLASLPNESSPTSKGSKSTSTSIPLSKPSSTSTEDASSPSSQSGQDGNSPNFESNPDTCANLKDDELANCLNKLYKSGSFSGSASSCSGNEFACTKDGKLAICNFGVWAILGCAPGTTCYAKSFSTYFFIGCGWPPL